MSLWVKKDSGELVRGWQRGDTVVTQNYGSFVAHQMEKVDERAQKMQVVWEGGLNIWKGTGASTND